MRCQDIRLLTLRARLGEVLIAASIEEGTEIGRVGKRQRQGRQGSPVRQPSLELGKGRIAY
jgi:hypothetical protein